MLPMQNIWHTPTGCSNFNRVAPTPQAAAALTQTYMGQLELWLSTNRMEVDTGKCVLTLVTPLTREYATQPRVTLNGIPIPVENTLHVLCVTLERGMTFRPHVQEVSVRARSRLGVLRVVTGTTFGNSKESVTALYKQYVRAVMEYACMSCLDSRPGSDAS